MLALSQVDVVILDVIDFLLVVLILELQLLDDKLCVLHFLLDLLFLLLQTAEISSYLLHIFHEIHLLDVLFINCLHQPSITFCNYLILSYARVS